MDDLRIHGMPPFKVAVIHGGPGAAGEVGALARELCMQVGVLEPFQTANTVEGQIEELKGVLADSGHPPLVLVGFSWGAWLSYLTAARYPGLVKKLVLVGSSPFEEKYTPQIVETRLRRLNGAEKKEFTGILTALETGAGDEQVLNRLGELTGLTDSFDPLREGERIPEANPEIYKNVWAQASALRRSGELLRMGAAIQCPLTAIHGDYDPHPFEGVKDPLSKVLKEFRFYLLRNCGHHPWMERQAREQFYSILSKELV